MLALKISTFTTIRRSSTLTSTQEALVDEELDFFTDTPFNGLGEILGGQRDIHSLFVSFRDLATNGGENHIPRLGANFGALDLNSVEAIRNYPSDLRENVLSTVYGHSNDLILPNVPIEAFSSISAAIGSQELNASLFNLVLAPGLANNSLLNTLASLVANPSSDLLTLLPNVIFFAVVPLNNLAAPGALYDVRVLLESINSLLQITTVASDSISIHSLVHQANASLSTNLANSVAQISQSAAVHLSSSFPIENIESVTPTETLSINTRQLLLASVIGVPWIIYTLASSLSDPSVAINDSNVLVISNNIDLIGSFFEKLKNFLKNRA